MDKPSLRADMKHALAALPPLQRALEEELVNAWVQGSPEWQQARTVALYRNKELEFSVTPVTNAAFRTGKRVTMPRIVDMAAGALHFHQVHDWSDLAPGGFGIMEPLPHTPLVGPEDVDLAIVPALAWTRDGQRLGQGGGFYDRVMTHFAGPTWGVGFDCQLVDEVPLQEHDRPVDRVLTRSMLGI